MISYELVALLHPDLEIDLEKPIKKIEQIITGAGGKIVKLDNWGKRKLAYPIRTQEFAIYHYWEAELPSDAIVKIDKALNISDEVLRHLITKHVEIPVEEETEKTKDDKLETDKKPSNTEKVEKEK